MNINKYIINTTVWKAKYSLTVGSEIIQRWLTYFEGLLNTENTRKRIENGLATEGPIDIFNENEVAE